MWSERGRPLRLAALPPVARRAGAVLALTLLGILAWGAFLDVGLVGWDTYPLILTGRIAGIPDLAGAFSEELMDGRYPGGHFYRPATSLLFGLDHALHGLDPRGFHATDLALLVANASLLLVVAARLFGPGRALAGGLAAGLFLLHPVHLELLPVPPRRADSLCLLFLLATLAVQRPTGTGTREPPPRPRWRRDLATGLLALGALGAKESGALVVPLVFGLQLLWGGWRPALRATLPVILAALPYAVGRLQAVGGLGGHEESRLAAIAGLPQLVPLYAARVLHPQPFVPGGGAPFFVLAAATGLVLLGILAWRRAPNRAAPGLRSALPFLGLWVLCTLGISSLSGRRQEWYALLFVAPYALLLGALLDEAARALRERPRIPAVLAAAVLLPLATGHVLTSPLLRPYDEWRSASEVAERFLARFDAAIVAAAPGDVLWIDGLPLKWSREEPPARVHGTWLLAPYSVQAYAELAHPTRRIVVDSPGPRPEPAPRGGIRVYVVPGRTPPPVPLASRR